MRTACAHGCASDRSLTIALLKSALPAAQTWAANGRRCCLPIAARIELASTAAAARWVPTRRNGEDRGCESMWKRVGFADLGQPRLRELFRF